MKYDEKLRLAAKYSVFNNSAVEVAMGFRDRSIAPMVLMLCYSSFMDGAKWQKAGCKVPVIHKEG